MARLEDNLQQAVIRLSLLKRRLEKDSSMKQKYECVMETYIANGHAQLASNEENSTCWYLPLHAVFPLWKPDKLRVVFDCAARFCGPLLNVQLSQEPNFFNALIGVLTRFRMEKIAVADDIEQRSEISSVFAVASGRFDYGTSNFLYECTLIWGSIVTELCSIFFA